MTTYLYIAQIIVSAALIAAILLQTKGGAIGGLFGAEPGAYRTRRGVEKTLFNITIGLAVVFFVLAIITVIQAK